MFLMGHRVYSPPGRLIAVDGHHLYLYCTGRGTPAVVFDSALGGSCLSWTWVQPQVAVFTQACSYDRAGFGWSDAGPLPRTADRLATELHALLTKAEIAAPYVLVGHSYGGLVTRLFAAKYRDQVAGLVLVDAALPEEWLDLTEEQQRRIATGAWLCRRGATLARLGIAQAIAWLVQAGAAEVARTLVAWFTRGQLRRREEQILAPVHRLPAHLRPILREMWTQPKFFEMLASQIESVPTSTAGVVAATGYSELVLVVLAAASCSQCGPGAAPAARSRRPSVDPRQIRGRRRLRALDSAGETGSRGRRHSRDGHDPARTCTRLVRAAKGTQQVGPDDWLRDSYLPTARGGHRRSEFLYAELLWDALVGMSILIRWRKSSTSAL